LFNLLLSFIWYFVDLVGITDSVNSEEKPVFVILYTVQLKN